MMVLHEDRLIINLRVEDVIALAKEQQFTIGEEQAKEIMSFVHHQFKDIVLSNIFAYMQE